MTGRHVADDDPVGAVNALGAVWSPDFDAYAAGEIPADQIRCALCRKAPCECPPVGSDAYWELIAEAHGKGRRPPGAT